MQKHEHYAELCSLAIIGELTSDEAADFLAHVHNCAECQSSFLELSQIASERMSLAVQQRTHVDTRTLAAVRRGALQRLSAEGVRISPEASNGKTAPAQRIKSRIDNLHWVVAARKFQTALLLTCLALTAVSVWVARQERSEAKRVAALNTELAKAKSMSPAEAPRVTPAAPVLQPTEDSSRLEKQIADAGEHIAKLEAEKVESLKTIGALQRSLDQAKSENSNLSTHAFSAESESTNLRSQIEQLRSRLASNEAEMTAAQYQVTSLTNQLKGQQSAIEHETELLAAGRDIRDVMGARNLHIIDVHDMDARGEARPFGRIFLTEGKRLIFYAYDLDSAKMKNAAFQAWGQRADGSKAAVNLGVLYVDDQKQARWALKVEDPNLLSAIDSLFVTVEPKGGTAKPTGKKLMYAYLHNPINHP